MKYLETYNKLIEKYLDNTFNNIKFKKHFSNYFYDKNLKSINNKEFILIKRIWGWLDRYEPKKELRKLDSSLIDEKQLKDKLKKNKKDIQKLLNK